MKWGEMKRIHYHECDSTGPMGFFMLLWLLSFSKHVSCQNHHGDEPPFVFAGKCCRLGNKCRTKLLHTCSNALLNKRPEGSTSYCLVAKRQRVQVQYLSNLLYTVVQKSKHLHRFTHDEEQTPEMYSDDVGQRHRHLGIKEISRLSGWAEWNSVWNKQSI